MKKSSVVLLLVFYCLVLILTLYMENVGIKETVMRAAVNAGTLLMALISGILVRLAFMKESEVEETVAWDKEKYLDYAKSSGLTKRETEIGMLIMHGYSNQKIADELYISEATVKKHVSHIYEKTAVDGRKNFRKRVDEL